MCVLCVQCVQGLACHACSAELPIPYIGQLVVGWWMRGEG